MKIKKLAIAVSVLAGTAMVAALTLTNGKVFSHLSGVKAVDSWTEKAYEAPTTSEVGYKHYYLGCPGNERTSDVDHNNPVTLEQITIPALTALDPADVDAENKITLINEAKIKWLDQSTTLGTDGGTAQYVLDQGHQAFCQESEVRRTGQHGY